MKSTKVLNPRRYCMPPHVASLESQPHAEGPNTMLRPSSADWLRTYPLTPPHTPVDLRILNTPAHR